MLKICFIFAASALTLNALPFDYDSLQKAIESWDESLILEKHGHSVEKHGHSFEDHGHSFERHGHSLEDHEVNKRKADEFDDEEREIEALINEVERNQAPSGERVEGDPGMNDVEASRVEAALKEEENKLLSDGEKAFQEFDKNINEAIKQSQAVEDEVRKDIDEQSEHRIMDKK